jgi:hypothetical protein
MKQFIRRHWPKWGQTFVILAAIGGIAGLREGCGLVGQGVDIGRAPEAIKVLDGKVDLLTSNIVTFKNDNDWFHARFLTTILTISNRQSILIDNQKQVIKFINTLTNHPPEWEFIQPQYTIAAWSTNHNYNP